MESLELEHIKQNVSTKPLVHGGANFETHILTKTNTGYTFKPSTFYAIFCGIFGTVAYGALLYAIYQFTQTGNLLFLNKIIS
ncbi:hypothetical protein ACKGJY_02995 [Hyunsoonleella sp. 2307UL5-6]|uniref:hypothetical protein n=1 Tax=Hyunsoonleella sp. 2307UL5-6 TaxID=3384768 RepID=UPI0039BC9A9B